MINTKYTFSKLQDHLSSIFEASHPVLNQHKEEWSSAIAVFTDHFEKLESEPPSLYRNTKMILSGRFLNHVLASAQLSRFGLFNDSVICERSALEALASYKLILVNPEAAEKYNIDSFPKPVEVRRQLKSLGYSEESKRIQELYKSLSRLTHISRKHERFSTSWGNRDTGLINIGGAYSKEDMDHMLEFLPAMIQWFFMPLVKNG
jgi:hypothetical protein